MKEKRKHYLNKKEIKKFMTEMSDSVIYCKKCGHSVNFLGKRDRMICNWCGNYIYKDDKTEFKYKMNQIRRVK